MIKIGLKPREFGVDLTHRLQPVAMERRNLTGVAALASRAFTTLAGE